MIKKLKFVIRDYIHKFPIIEALVDSILLNFFELRVRMTSYINDVDKICWVNPQKIEYVQTFDFLKPADYNECVDWRWQKLEPDYNKRKYMGKVIGGDWDKHRRKFSEMDVYQAFQDRFINGKAWRDTEFYQQILKAISAGYGLWGCKNKSEFDKRCKCLDSLYEDIKEKGYKTQKHISGKESNHIWDGDEMTVRMGRHGEFLFEDGRHRLSIAKLLNLSEIPVKITVRHYEWYKFREEIITYVKKNGGKLYHPITHPDLNDIPAVHGEHRFNIIKPHLPEEKGDLLDIGANWGYFCHKFEEEGFNCYAVENDPTNVYFLEKLKRAENRNFKVINKSIFEYSEKTDFDIVLVLNIFHHFLKKEETYRKLIELLERLSMKVMFFEPHSPDESQMTGAYRNYNPGEFVNFVLKHSNLNNAQCIGEAEDERSIYMLYN